MSTVDVPTVNPRLSRVFFADRVRFFWRARLYRHAVQLDDRPALEADLVERREHPLRSTFPRPSSTKQFSRDRSPVAPGTGDFDILDMQEDQPVAILPDRLGRVAAALLIVRRVELQRDVSFGSAAWSIQRTSSGRSPRLFMWLWYPIGIPTSAARLPISVSTPARAACSRRRQSGAPSGARRSTADIRRRRTVTNFAWPACLSISLFTFDRGIDSHVSARQRRHRQLVLREEVAQRLGPIAVCLQDVRPELNPRKAQRRHVLDRLDVVAVPGDCRAAELDTLFRQRDCPRRRDSATKPAAPTVPSLIRKSRPESTSYMLHLPPGLKARRPANHLPPL